MARKAFITGLADHDLRWAVHMRTPASFNEALTAAVQIEAVGKLVPAPKRPRVAAVAGDDEPLMASTSFDAAN